MGTRCCELSAPLASKCSAGTRDWLALSLSNNESGSIFRWRSNNDAAFGILPFESTLRANYVARQTPPSAPPNIICCTCTSSNNLTMANNGYYATILWLLSTCKKMLSTCKSHVQLWNIACKNHVQVWNIEIYYIPRIRAHSIPHRPT